MNVQILDHPLVQHKLTLLRAKETSCADRHVARQPGEAIEVQDAAHSPTFSSSISLMLQNRASPRTM